MACLHKYLTSVCPLCHLPCVVTVCVQHVSPRGGDLPPDRTAGQYGHEAADARGRFPGRQNHP